MAENTRPQDPRAAKSPPTPSSRQPPVVSAADAELALQPDFAHSNHPAKFSLRAPPNRAEQRRTGHERILRKRMQLAAGAFWVWLVVAISIAVVGVPLGRDGDMMAALKEVSRFAAAFERAPLERNLVARAIAKQGAPLEKVAPRITGRGVPKVTVADAAQPIAAYAKLELITLAGVNALTAPGAKIAIEVARPEPLAEALSWRLSRLGNGSERYLLQRIALTEATCLGADLQREQDVTRMRTSVLQARTRTTAAEQKQLSAERRYEAIRKWKKAPPKAIAKANESRIETKTALDEAQRQLVETATGYEAAVEQALRIAGGSTQDGKEVACRVAVATLIEKTSNKPLDLRIPARVDRRNVAAPKVAGAEFPVAKRVGVWDQIKDGTPELAVAHLRARFSWHYRHADLLGVKVGGMTVLQFAPLILLAMAWLLLRSCRRVSATYNPFDAPIVDRLPSVGFGKASLNLVAMVALPCIGCALCAWSLVRIDQTPLVPVLCGIASVGLGIYAYLALRRLLDLREAIMQTHSNPPRRSK